MVLLEVKGDDGWLHSRWNLTNPASWQDICKASAAMFDFYTDTEVLVDGNPVPITAKEQILKLEEAGNMTLRGKSTIIGVPLMITFYNQTQVVNVTVAGMTEEFFTVDYQRFNMSMGQYLDSVELAMYI